MRKSRLFSRLILLLSLISRTVSLHFLSTRTPVAGFPWTLSRTDQQHDRGCEREGFKKELELVGVGYRVSNQGNLIEFSLGYTHPIFIELPKEVKVETKSERNQNPIITLECADKQLLGLICAKIRSFRKPEPYKGKGVLFKGEVIRRKSGKTAAAVDR